MPHAPAWCQVAKRSCWLRILAVPPPLHTRRHLLGASSAGFDMWLAGGSVKPGIKCGSTDETGATAMENKVHLHDLHATMLHLLGLDHEKLTVRHAGRDFRLTDVYGEVKHGIIA